jgi:hypothetical protein
LKIIKLKFKMADKKENINTMIENAQEKAKDGVRF